MASRLAAIDPVGIEREYLAGHPDIAALFAEYPGRLLGGGQDTSVRIVEVPAPPYPCLRVVNAPGGSMRDGRWLVEPLTQVEAWGDTDGYPGPEALKVMVVTAVEVLFELPDRDYAPWESVVTSVDASWPYALDDPSGQARWISTVTLMCHPPLAPESAPEHADRAAPSEQRAYAATRDDYVPTT